MDEHQPLTGNHHRSDSYDPSDAIPDVAEACASPAHREAADRTCEGEASSLRCGTFSGCWRAISLASTSVTAFFAGISIRRPPHSDDRSGRAPPSPALRDVSVTSAVRETFHPGRGYEQLSDDEASQVVLPSGKDGAPYATDKSNREDDAEAAAHAREEHEGGISGSVGVRYFSRCGKVVAVIDGVEHAVDSAAARRARRGILPVPGGGRASDATARDGPAKELVSHSSVRSAADLIRRVTALAPLCPFAAELTSNGTDERGRELLELTVIGPVSFSRVCRRASPLTPPRAATHGASQRGRISESLSFTSADDMMTLSREAQEQLALDAIVELEDLLLQDLDDSRLVLFMLHVMDVTAVAAPISHLAMPARDSPTMSSNPDVDDLHYYGNGGGDGSAGQTGLRSDAVAAAAISESVVLLVQHLVAFAPLTHLSLTRCSMTPAELESIISPARLHGLKHLCFSKCSLADAHVYALLRLASQESAPLAFVETGEKALMQLRHLQLSGSSLSVEAVARLVAWIIDVQDADQATASGGALPLRELVVPGPIAARLRDELSQHVDGDVLALLKVNGKLLAGNE